ncbi:MAG: hypothetical protein Q8M94_08755, partial [Ignavibacteria bacterium]|nr:hypothetical protein [Ignavibacteria bacterium]
MFSKIENRLVLLIIFILLSLAAVIIYLKAKEKDFIKLISVENNLSLQTSILNLLSIEFSDSVFEQTPNGLIAIDNYNSRKKNEIILPDNSIKNFDDTLINKISNATGSIVKIINKNEQAANKQKLEDKPYISFVFINLLDEKNDISKVLFAQKESDVLRNKFNSVNKEYFILALIILLFSLIITAVLFLQIVRPISTII